jgi:hypothetical protein
MADYRKLVIDLIAADGTFDATETKVLKKALWSDGKITREEVYFIGELRAVLVKKSKGEPTEGIDKFFLAALHENVLGNGIISAEEVDIIKKHVIGDKRLVAHAKKFLDGLKKKATTIPPEFDALYGSIPTPKK